MAMAGICEVCGGTSMTSGGDGFSYCNQCGSQSQYFQDQAMDFEEGLWFSSRHVRETGLARNESKNLAKNESQQQAALQQAATLEDLTYLQASQFNSQFASQFGASLQAAGYQSQVAGSGEDGDDDEDEDEGVQLEWSENDRHAARVRKVYLQGMQLLVQMQCEALVQRRGVNPIICGILGPIWMKFLRGTGVFEKGWAEEALQVAEVQHHVGDTESSVEDPPKVESAENKKPIMPEMELMQKRLKKGTEEPRTSYGGRARFVWLRNLRGRIPLRSSLAITYLVCYLAREPILPTDIINWAFEGTIPYLSAQAEIERRANWNGKLLALAKAMFQPVRMTNARIVEYLASLIKDRLGLDVPPVNIHAISRRFLKELDLPVERFAPFICRIFEWFPSSGLWLSSEVTIPPTRVYVMAMLVVVFKVFYKLDGRNRNLGRCTPNSEVEVEMQALKLQEEEDEWNVEEFVAKMKLVLHNDLKHIDLKHVDGDEKLNAYLRYCREYIFPVGRMTSDEKSMRDHFWGIYEKSSKLQTAGEKHITDGDIVEHDVRITKAPSTHIQDNQKIIAVATGENSLQILHSDEQENAKDCLDGFSTAQSSHKNSITSIPLKKASMKLQIDPLLKGMEDQGFILLKPIKRLLRVDDYITYTYNIRNGKRSVHEEYYIVLLACSKIIDVDPQALQLCIGKVEKGLVKTEKNIVQFLALTTANEVLGKSDEKEMELNAVTGM